MVQENLARTVRDPSVSSLRKVVITCIVLSICVGQTQKRDSHNAGRFRPIACKRSIDGQCQGWWSSSDGKIPSRLKRVKFSRV